MNTIPRVADTIGAVAKGPFVEYLLVTDRDSKVLKSSTDYYEIKKLANLIRRGGGEVTIFRSTAA